MTLVIAALVEPVSFATDSEASFKASIDPQIVLADRDHTLMVQGTINRNGVRAQCCTDLRLPLLKSREEVDKDGFCKRRRLCSENDGFGGLLLRD